MGDSSIGAHGESHVCVQIDSDVIEALRRQILTSRVTVKNLLDSVTERAHKVLSQETEVRVKVDVCVCVALGGEVGSKEGPLVVVELLTSGVDGYGPEILLAFCTRVREKQPWSFGFGKTLKMAYLKNKLRRVVTWVYACVV